MGVGSNLIVRDGGLRAVVIRLGRGFNGIAVEGDTVTAGAAALDAHVARKAAEAGLDLTFLRTIPGSIGGAVRMNAGCYGQYVADVSARNPRRDADGHTCRPCPQPRSTSRYRQSDLPRRRGDPFGATLPRAPRRSGGPGRKDGKTRSPSAMPASPPRTAAAGSTFRNPAGSQQHRAGG